MQRFQREPGFAGVYAFGAANVVLHALQKQRRRRGFKETLPAVRHFEGVQNPFSFDDFGDVKRPQASISIVRDGEFVVLE